MYTNKIAALAGAAAIIDQAAALNIFRQEHSLEKKQDVVVWETVVHTVYVTEGAPAPKATQYVDAGKPTSIVVVTSQAPKIDIPVVDKAPAPSPVATSLKTSVKPATPTGTGSTGGSSSGPGFSGKRGLAYNNAVMANLVGSSCKKGACGWAYNWGQFPGNLDSKYSFVPTLWGPNPNVDFFSTWSSSASKAIADGSKALFSFNEPDNKSQANMLVADAAAKHVQYMNPFSGKALIGAPSVSNSNLAGEGLEYLKSWVSECESKGCKYDFCNVHWYNTVSATESLFDHIKQAHEICGGKPIWLTEFAPVQATDAQTASFLAEVIPRLDSLEYLDAYSYFMVDTQALQLLSSSSTLSTIGNKYVSL